MKKMLTAAAVLAAGGAWAQPQPAATPGTSERPVSAPASGRNAFIAPVVDIRIQDQGLALPTGMEEPPIPAPVQAPAAPPKSEEPAKGAAPATAK